MIRLIALLLIGALQGAVIKKQYQLGGNAGISGVAVDVGGFIYEVGGASSASFPTTPGSFIHFSGSQSTTNPYPDVFIRKLSADGSQVIYSVLIGGSANQMSTGIAVDAQGNVFVTGYTNSPDFPVTVPSAHIPGGSDLDGFVFELDPTGTKLIFSRLFGGGGSDLPFGIALAPDGRVVVAGSTASTDFPVTSNALQGAASASGSAFIVRFARGVVDYATYLGGTGGAIGKGIAIDKAGDIYVTGYAGAFFPTLSTSFASQSPFGGFVSKLDHATGQLVYSTYLPGVAPPSVGPGGALAIQVDGSGHAYVAGPASAGFPATAGAFQTEPNSDPFARYPLPDAFALELDETGSSLVFATLFGGAGDDAAVALALNGDSITIAGVTTSLALPLTDFGLPVCNMVSIPGASTTFVASFDHRGRLVTAFEFGACGQENPTAVAMSPSGLIMTGTSVQSAFLLLLDLNATAPTQISAVADAASLEIGTYAPLEILTLVGTGLGPARGVSGAPTNGAFPMVLAGTQVFIGGRLAPLLYVSANQVNAVVPASGSFPWAGITVSTQAGSSATITTFMENANPSLFTMNGSGVGPGAILNQDNTVNSPSNPATRGSTIVLFGTGGGLISPLFADGQIAPTASQLVMAPYLQVGFGGTAAGKVLYAGAAPGEINGLVQVNVTIPSGAPTGPAVPILLSLYPYQSQSGVTVAIR